MTAAAERRWRRKNVLVSGAIAVGGGRFGFRDEMILFY